MDSNEMNKVTTHYRLGDLCPRKALKSVACSGRQWRNNLISIDGLSGTRIVRTSRLDTSAIESLPLSSLSTTVFFPPLDRRRFHEGHKEALQQFVDGTKEEDQTGSQLYADDTLSGNSLTVDGEFARQLTAFAPSVGIIVARTADGASCYGTGFRVGDNYILTNLHVARYVKGKCCTVR